MRLTPKQDILSRKNEIFPPLCRLKSIWNSERHAKIVREPADEGICEGLHLLIRDSKGFTNGVQQRLQNQRERGVVADFSRFGCHEAEQFAKGTVVCVGTLRDREDHIPNADNGQVAGKRIKGRTAALLQEL